MTANRIDVDATARESRGEFDESGGIYFYRKAWGIFAHDIALAIRNAALEEAANKCEAIGEHYCAVTPSDCATSIRALKEQP